MLNQTELYKKTSNISRIIDYTNQVESFANGSLDQNTEHEQKLLVQITRNTNSIKALIYKYIAKLTNQTKF